MYTTLIVLMVIIAIVLILVVLIQNPKGGGISGEISGGNRMFGVQQTGDILEKITWGAASLIVIFAVVSSLLTTTGNSTELDSANVNAAQSKAAPAQKPTTIPAQPAPAQPATAPAK
jgi:preprotein translocase subunit SecG